MSESRMVPIVGGVEVTEGVLTIAEAEPWELTLVVAGRRYASVGPDLFEALTGLRRALEADGLLIGVAGACADVYPSGMSRQMSGGRSAYRHPIDRRPDLTDLVDIFDDASGHDVVRVDEQLASIRRLQSRE